MSAELEREFPVDSRMVDCFNMCRPSSLLGFLQETAAEHFLHMACSRAQLVSEYGVVWVMTRQWYRLDRPLYRGDSVLVRTWQRGPVGPVIYRDFDLFSGGELVGEAVGSWVLLDVNTHRPVRFSRVPLIQDTPKGAHPKSILLEKLSPPEAPDSTEQRTVRYSDCDSNRHMNNVRYADFACDAFHYEQMEGKHVSSMQLCYLAECYAGETLNLTVGQRGARTCVSGTNDAGSMRFIAETGFFGKQEVQG